MSRFLFPRLCSYCKDELEAKERLLCKTCLEQLEFLTFHERCHRCFSLLPCKRCEKLPFTQIAALFDAIGPAQSLRSAFHEGFDEKAAETIASLMVLQLSHLCLPTPDIITYPPFNISSYLLRGYNKKRLIAKFLSQFLERPVYNLLRSRIDISDKKVLLIDETYTARTAEIGRTLCEGFPKELFALIFVN
jgi:predicted amidophosphoribosyltransferase